VLLITNYTLQELNLSWNHICKESALKLAKSLAQNKGLTSLNISYNNIGDIAAQHLANSLRYHPTLTNVDVSYNMILPRGVMVFAHALTTNVVLRELNLNGNSIGQIGCSCLLRAVRLLAKHKRIINVHYRGGNLIYQDATLFDRDNPSGDYSLDLKSPYDSAVAFWLHEIGNAKPISKVTDLKYLPEGGKQWITVKLTRDLTIKSSNGPWDSHISAINRLVDMAVDTEIASGENSSSTVLKNRLRLIRRELCKSIKSIGANVSLRFRSSFTNSVRIALERTPKNKRSMLHEVLKTIFRTAFRLVVKRNTADENDSWMHKENLVKCFDLLGFGLSEQDMEDEDEEDEDGGDNHAHAGAAPDPVMLAMSRKSARLSRRNSSQALLHARKAAHVHSTNYEVKQLEETSHIRKEDQELVERIQCVEEMETSGRERLHMAERIIAGQNIDGSDILDESNFIRMMLVNFTEFSPPLADPLMDASTGQPWVLPTEGSIKLKFECDRMPPSNDEIQSRESFAIFSNVQ
jgi:hypothetical protein